jgi:carboxymethylenebutenolidase
VTKAVQDLMVEVERVRDRFLGAVLAADPDEVRGLSTSDATLEIDPTGTGAAGSDALRRFIADQVVVPPDLTLRRRSRTGDRWQVVDEDTAAFTHDREMPWLLPGVPATGRPAEVDVVTVVAVRRSLVVRCRMLWDLLGLADQLGLDPRDLRRRGSLVTDVPRGA